jgi:hypothetical protein
LAKRLTQTQRLQRQLDDLLDVHQCADLFDRTPMTISLWRRYYHMPTVVVNQQGARAIHRFVREDVKRWAKAVLKAGKVPIKPLISKKYL